MPPGRDGDGDLLDLVAPEDERPGKSCRPGGFGSACEAAIIPHPSHRTPVAPCDGPVRRIVPLCQLAVQQRVDPDIGTPPTIRAVWLRPETRRRLGPRGLPGGQSQRLCEGPGLHDVVIEPPGVGVLSQRDVERSLPGTRRRLGPRGLPGGQSQRLCEGPGLHDVVIEPPGVRMLSQRDVEQRHRQHCIGHWFRRRFEGTAPGTRSAEILISSMPDDDLARSSAENCGGHVPGPSASPWPTCWPPGWCRAGRGTPTCRSRIICSVITPAGSRDHGLSPPGQRRGGAAAGPSPRPSRMGSCPSGWAVPVRRSLAWTVGGSRSLHVQAAVDRGRPGR